MSSVRKPAIPALPARYFGLLCDLLHRMGFDVARVERAAGVESAASLGPDAMLSLEQVEALVAAAGDLTGRDDIGFELGRLVKLSTHDILGYGLLSSPTLDAALRLATRFHRLVLPTFAMDYRRDANVAEFRFQPIVPMTTQTLGLHLEVIAVALHQQLDWLLGRHIRPYDIHIGGPVPPRRRYRELSPARVHFDANGLPGVRIVMEPAMADQPLAMADSSTLAMAQARCEALLQRAGEAVGISDWVKMMLRESGENMPTLRELAQILRVGPHTLDRRLRKEGHRFLDLSTRSRHERARELLEQGGRSITQVAHLLGYCDAANFTRAFKRACGITPREYQALRGRAGRNDFARPPETA